MTTTETAVPADLARALDRLETARAAMAAGEPAPYAAFRASDERGRSA